jgi:alpha-methylacyl-CoA racemase
MGPLAGLTVVELAGLGPAPLCCMMLAQMGADVIRIDRPEDTRSKADPRLQPVNRGRRSIAVDLKSPAGADIVKRLVRRSGVLVEGFRPGVAERLGLGPEDCWKVNEALVYGRMTGWGQDGPLANVVGHDINYIALNGVLDSIGSDRNGPPVPPLNLVGDNGGGALYLAFGLVCAVLESRQSGKGQVVDAAIIDGSAHLMVHAYSLMAGGWGWGAGRGENIVSGANPWYTVYETSDGKYVSVGAVEERFYVELVKRLGLDPDELPKRHDRANWPSLRETFAAVFRRKTREEWTAELTPYEVCFAPVLSPKEAVHNPQVATRGAVIEVDGVLQAGPAPRFSRTEAELGSSPVRAGHHTAEILGELGLSEGDIGGLKEQGVVA